MMLYPSIEPYATGRLQVSRMHNMYYEEVGNPKGRDVLCLHGGPGFGTQPFYRRFFDPQHYRTILYDQRGAGLSTPIGELDGNTTNDLVSDIEVLREHLEIDKWLVRGGSWGSTLALCYAIQFPERVTGLLLNGIFLGRHSEHVWLLGGGGASEIYPEEWAKFREMVIHVPEEKSVSAYRSLLNSNDRKLQLKAARSWCRWSSILSLYERNPAILVSQDDEDSLLVQARIECHYEFHSCFLDSDNFVLNNVVKLRHIPTTIVHGRRDMICPVKSAWDLHNAMSGSELKIVERAGHSAAGEEMSLEIVKACDSFKSVMLS